MLPQQIKKLIQSKPNMVLDSTYNVRYRTWCIYRDLTLPIRNVYGFIERLVYWMPVLWNDRDWDDSFLMIIMRHKLLSMANNFEKYGHAVGSEKCAKQMRQVAKYLTRFIDDEHCKRAFDDFYKKHPFDDNWLKGEPDENGWVTVKFEPDEKRMTAYKKLSARKQKMQDNELLMLTEILRKHIREWWD